jgi:phytoene dehydrogenase-like protein
MIFDFVFIGSGHNALTCAAYLAKSGASVALFEKDNDVGGACRTVEVTMQGFRHDIGSIIHTNMPNSPLAGIISTKILLDVLKDTILTGVHFSHYI